VQPVLYALLFLPAVVAIAYALLRPRPRVMAEAVPDNPFATLEALLEQLEHRTLDERDAAELEALAQELEAAAARLERVG
jgi:hypothetical protein